MKKSKLKLKKFQVAKLTNLSNIFGGNGETTFTTTGNDNSDTQAPTTQATDGPSTACPATTGDDSCNCESNTSDFTNGDTSVP